MPDFRLGEIQRLACEYLIAAADEDGEVEYCYDDLANATGTRNLYDIFRQLYLKGIIAAMPERLTKTDYRVKFTCPNELRQVLGAMRVITEGGGELETAGDVVMSSGAFERALDAAILEEIRLGDASEERLAALIEVKRAIASGSGTVRSVRVQLKESA